MKLCGVGQPCDDDDYDGGGGVPARRLPQAQRTINASMRGRPLTRASSVYQSIRTCTITAYVILHETGLAGWLAGWLAG